MTQACGLRGPVCVASRFVWGLPKRNIAIFASVNKKPAVAFATRSETSTYAHALVLLEMARAHAVAVREEEGALWLCVWVENADPPVERCESKRR
jgi:hypothetical protein